MVGPADRGVRPQALGSIKRDHAQGMLDAGFRLRRGDWKNISYVGGYRPRLCNPRDDPDEFRDRAWDPSGRRVWSDLRAALRTIVDPEAVDTEAKAINDESTTRRHQACLSVAASKTLRTIDPPRSCAREAAEDC